jgi:hypothetical protein
VSRVALTVAMRFHLKAWSIGTKQQKQVPLAVPLKSPAMCDKVIWRGGSWYPGIDDKEELIQETQELLDEKIGEE